MVLIESCDDNQVPKRGHQGEGGGRPPRPGGKARMTLELSPKAAELLRARAESQGQPLWAALDALILEHLDPDAPKPPSDPGEDRLVALQLARTYCWHLEPERVLWITRKQLGLPPGPEPPLRILGIPGLR